MNGALGIWIWHKLNEAQALVNPLVLDADVLQGIRDGLSRGLAVRHCFVGLVALRR